MVQIKQNFSEDRALPKARSVNEDAATSGGEQQKPKRVLTEAQRLAFLKGREKRMANLERKRQEKIEAEEKTAPMAPPPLAEPKTKIEPPSQPEPQPETEPEVEPQSSTSTSPELEEPVPSMPIVKRHANSDETAKKIADLILERMEMKRAAPVNTTPPPKKARGRPRTKEVAVRGPESSEEESSPSPPPLPVFAPRQRVFNWM